MWMWMKMKPAWMRFLGRPQPAATHFHAFSAISATPTTFVVRLLLLPTMAVAKTTKITTGHATVGERTWLEQGASSCELRAPTLWHGNVPGGFLWHFSKLLMLSLAICLYISGYLGICKCGIEGPVHLAAIVRGDFDLESFAPARKWKATLRIRHGCHLIDRPWYVLKWTGHNEMSVIDSHSMDAKLLCAKPLSLVRVLSSLWNPATKGSKCRKLIYVYVIFSREAFLIFVPGP